jgi:hypothetical protein
MTPEGMIGALSGLIGKVDDPQVIQAAVGIALVSEFATLVDRNAFNSGMIGVLTDLYDAEDFEYLTRSRGRETVHNPCLSILGGSTLHWIKECVPLVSVGGGFTSRIVFVYKEEREKVIARPKMTNENRQRFKDAMHDLNEIAKMRGPFAMDEAAGEMYDREYEHFYHHSNLMEDANLSGYAGRRHDILMKVAMVISASRSDNRLITTNELQIAIAIMHKAEEAMPKILKAITAKEVGDIFEQIIRYISRHKIVARPQLINQFRHKLTGRELDELMRTLEGAGIVGVQVDGKTVRYTFLKDKEV